MEFVLAIVILLLDQGTKIWAERALSRQPLVLIPGALELTYLENRGAVWGLMQGWRIVFLIATFLFLGIMLFFYCTNHLKANNGSAIFKKNNIIDIIFSFCLVYKQAGKTLSCNINWCNYTVVSISILKIKANIGKINILSCRKHR